ncbi:tetratricopeptide repeat protein [Anaeromyxobacter oryzae]|uniref:dolichyl-phosphate-mannose--protein mannosyltransferase n=1 Tax=Anaeromyxobacter oryzae TaxID=2918170 RepID=A0ABN6N112_9BACT|nr:tetratricopeptide repeat protein [Anaeromyxobacter oryzae]BDG06848.1 hypothetical protein AMOR_58440 [Anaeromyxobacter oryzae]
MPLAPRSPARRWALAALLAGALTYAPTLRHGFAFDDGIVIVKNRLIRTLEALPSLVSSTEWAGGGLLVRAWRPLTDATYALNHAASGLAPWSYHLANALLHGLVAALVVLVAVRLGVGAHAAGIAGLLFAVHPIHVEAVANVVGRKDLLATAFLLAMVLAHRWGARRGGTALALAPLAYAAAMLSKEVGAVGIALVGLLDLLIPEPAGGGEGGDDPGGVRELPPHPGPLPRGGRGDGFTKRRGVVLYACHAVVLGIYLLLYRAVTAGAHDPIPFEDNPAASAPGAVRLLTAVAVVGKGLLLQLLPVRLSPDYSFDAIPVVATPLDPRFLAAAALLAGWAAAGAWAWRRRGAPLGLAALAWYLVALLPASNLLFPIGTIFGERLLYLPSVATAVLAGVAVAAASASGRPERGAARTRGPESGGPPWWPRAALAGVALLAGALTVATVRYAAAWESDRTLFEHAARVVPRSSKVQHKLAVVRLEAGDPEGALAAIERALALRPGTAALEIVHAEILRALHRPDDEAAALERALAAAPSDPDALYALGRRARDEGRLDEAERYWRRALAERREHASALADLSTLALVRGDADAALPLALRAVDADERQASAWYNLGLMYRARGDATRARDAFARFVASAGPEYAAEAGAVREMLARGEPR